MISTRFTELVGCSVGEIVRELAEGAERFLVQGAGLVASSPEPLSGQLR